MLACRELCAAHRTEISFDTYKHDDGKFKSISSKTEVSHLMWILDIPLESFRILEDSLETRTSRDMGRSIALWGSWKKGMFHF